MVDLISNPNGIARPPPAPVAEVILCEEQQNVVDLILAGHKVFYRLRGLRKVNCAQVLGAQAPETWEDRSQR